MLASVRSAVLEGVDGRIVTVEVHVSRGLPGYTVVGLPDAAGRESGGGVPPRPQRVGPESPATAAPVDPAPGGGPGTGCGGGPGLCRNRLAGRGWGAWVGEWLRGVWWRART